MRSSQEEKVKIEEPKQDAHKTKMIFDEHYAPLSSEEKRRLYSEQWELCQDLMQEFEIRRGEPEGNVQVLVPELAKLLHYRRHFLPCLGNPIFNRPAVESQAEVLERFFVEFNLVDAGYSNLKKNLKENLPIYLNDIENDMHKYRLNIDDAVLWFYAKDPKVAQLLSSLQLARVNELGLWSAESAREEIKKFFESREKQKLLPKADLSKEKMFDLIQKLTNDFLNFDMWVVNNEIERYNARPVLFGGLMFCPNATFTLTEKTLSRSKNDIFTHCFYDKAARLMSAYLQFGAEAFVGNVDVTVTKDPQQAAQMLINAYTSKNKFPDGLGKICTIDALVKNYQKLDKTMCRYQLTSEQALDFLQVKVQLKHKYQYSKFFQMAEKNLPAKLEEARVAAQIELAMKPVLDKAFETKMIASKLRQLSNVQNTEGMECDKFVKEFETIDSYKLS